MTAISTAITAAKISATRVSMVKAMTIAPNTTKGERSISLSAMFTPVWAWLTSLVMRVIIADVPSRSTSEKDSPDSRSNSAWRTSAAKYVAARAAKYCAVMAAARPSRPSRISTPHIRQTCPPSAAPMPRSMIDATTSGTNSSSVASNILKSGAQMHSILYFFRYLSIFDGSFPSFPSFII